jgi:transcriptional regulator with XRE-family HTH domain
MGLLRTYRFTDKDPVTGELQTLLEDEGLFKNLKTVAELSGLHPSTVKNIFHGGTKRPQNATVMAIATSIGYKRGPWMKSRDLNVEQELEFARKWNQRERERRAKLRPPKKRKRA